MNILNRNTYSVAVGPRVRQLGERVGSDGRTEAARVHVRVGFCVGDELLVWARTRTGQRGAGGGDGAGVGDWAQVADGGALAAVVRVAECEHFEQAAAVIQELLRHTGQRARLRESREAARVEHEPHLRDPKVTRAIEKLELKQKLKRAAARVNITCCTTERVQRTMCHRLNDELFRRLNSNRAHSSRNVMLCRVMCS